MPTIPSQLCDSLYRRHIGLVLEQGGTQPTSTTGFGDPKGGKAICEILQVRVLDMQGGCSGTRGQ